jgi:hypothetical protein
VAVRIDADDVDAAGVQPEDAVRQIGRAPDAASGGVAPHRGRVGRRQFARGDRRGQRVAGVVGREVQGVWQRVLQAAVS